MIKIEKYNETYLNKSWYWLNDSEIKKLTQTPDFTKEDQQKWFNSLKKQINYKIWGISYNDLAIGVCGLKKITQNDCEYWGYIGEKAYWGKGIGSLIIDNMIQKAIELNLSSIWLSVACFNQRAIGLYQKKGFVIEKETENAIIMRLNIMQ